MRNCIRPYPAMMGMTTDWRDAAAAWWASPEWASYEEAYGDEPGTRTRLLAAATWATRILDLTPPEQELWRGVRKSYHAIINKGRRRYTTTVNPLGIEEARALHYLAAGHFTRAKRTWDLMGEWLRDGHALLIVATDGGMPNAYAIWITHHGWAYYASGAALVDNVQHAVIWESILALKARGITTVELGWQAKDGDTEKDRGIATFKRGFGGVDAPVVERACAR